MFHIIVRGSWCEIIFLNSPTEDKSSDKRETFDEEQEHMFD
jgi:hypothetical protein